MSDTKKVVVFLTGAVEANGKFDENEKEAVSSIAKALGVDKAEFHALIEAEMKNQRAMSEEDLDKYFHDMAEGINEDDAIQIYQFCLQAVFADNEFTIDEVEVMVGFAEALDIEIAEAIMMMFSFEVPED